MDSDIEKRLQELERRVEELERSRRPPERAAERPLTPTAPRYPAAPAPKPVPPSAAPSVVSSEPPRPAVPAPRADLETLIGGSLLNRVGMLAVFLGAAYFLKLAYDNQWIGPLGRTVAGLLAGIGFFLAGERLRGRGLNAYGQVLSGGGIAILYLSLFAAYQFWHLLSQPVAFLCMAAVTATATLLAARTEAPFIALLGALGGFLTPALLSTGVDNQVGLFSYVILLNLGLLVTAYLRGWGFLSLTAFALTQVTWIGWASAFYERAKWVPTHTFLILLFGLFIAGAGALRKRQTGALPAVLAALNGLAFFLGSVLNLWEEPRWLLTFFILANGALALLLRGPAGAWARRIAFTLTVLPWLLWFAIEYGPELRALSVVFLTLFFIVHLASGAAAFFRERRASSPEIGVAFANAAFFYGSLYGLLREDYPDLMGPLAVLVGVPYFLLGQKLYRRSPEALLPVYILLGIALTFVTLAIPIQLHQHWITLAWAVEGAILTWVGFKAESPTTRRAAAVVLVLAVGRLVFYDASLADGVYRALANRRVFIWGAVAASLLLSASFFKRGAASLVESERRFPDVYVITAAVLLLILGSYEVNDYFRHRLTLERAQLPLGWRESLIGLQYQARMSLSVFWAVYAGLLVVLGISRDYRPIRWLGIGVLGLTAFKVFLVDLASLAQIYRVVSLVVTGIVFLGASYLYQRLVGKKAALVLAVVLPLAGASSTHAAWDSSSYRFRRPVQLPAGELGKGFVRVPVPVAVFTQAGPELRDLRIVAGERDEVGYHIRVLSRTVERRELTPRLLNLSRTAAGGIRFDLDLPDQAAPHNQIELSLEGEQFIRRVSVQASEDRRQWVTLLDDGFVFRVDRPGRSEKQGLSYPESIYPFLRVTVAPGMGELRVSGAKLFRVVETPGVEETVDGVLSEQKVEPAAKASRFVLDLGGPGIPIHRLDWDIVSGNFSRRVEIAASDEREGKWQQFGGQTVYRLPLNIREERDTGVRVEAAFRFYQATFLNGDNPPLAVRGARASFYRRELVFSARPSERYFLYYGSREASPPQYDTGAVASRLELDALPVGTLGAEEPNPLFRLPEKPFTDRYPGLLWGALILLVAVLGTLIVRAMRAPARPPA
jgi:uncharacterized membrane protein